MTIAKILPLHDLARELEASRRAGLRIVHCHGCFDLLHIGHIRHGGERCRLTRPPQALRVALTLALQPRGGAHGPASEMDQRERCAHHRNVRWAGSRASGPCRLIQAGQHAAARQAAIQQRRATAVPAPAQAEGQQCLGNGHGLWNCHYLWSCRSER